MPRPQPSEWSVKRILGYLSWHRNRKAKHSADVLTILKADMALFPGDHIIFGGDQTNLALDSEYRAVREWAQDLGKSIDKSSADISMIPGNHDAYRKDHESAFWQFWGMYAQGDDSQNQEFPFVRKRGKMAIIGVSSAIQTPPFAAWGKVGTVQLEKLRAVLRALGSDGYCRMIAIHHPPQKNGAIYRKRLIDAAAFRQVIEETGAELILHGHNHKMLMSEIKGPHAMVPVRGSGSGSSNGKGMQPAHYQVIEIEDAADHWNIRINHRRLEPDRRVFATTESEILNLPKPAGLR